MLLSDSPNRKGNYDTILVKIQSRGKKKVKKKKKGGGGEQSNIV